jgi:hypothetical protein
MKCDMWCKIRSCFYLHSVQIRQCATCHDQFEKLAVLFLGFVLQFSFFHSQTLTQHMQSHSAAAAAAALTAHAALKNSVYGIDQRVSAAAEMAQTTADAFRAHRAEAAEANATVMAEMVAGAFQIRHTKNRTIEGANTKIVTHYHSRNKPNFWSSIRDIMTAFARQYRKQCAQPRPIFSLFSPHSHSLRPTTRPGPATQSSARPSSPPPAHRPQRRPASRHPRPWPS